ncbi:inositol 2-dehydrogenase [Lentisphaerota bacterium ZTH]|nr:inositol 2-dehydrogenase [Lentisphaerota bacterium]WET07537.1 inositol 2-dehydrogenase [Lentisphaerota bacterium ZTH]
MQQIITGVIGAGRIGRLHAENLIFSMPRQFKVKSIADPYIDRTWAEESGIPVILEDYKEILNDPEIEAVLICSPSDMHADQIIEAAAAGKQIFCEKPVALDINRIKECIEACKEAGVICQVGFNRRFDPDFAKVRESVKNGQLGEPHIVRITSRDPEPPPAKYIKQSGGIFLDMTIHDFDMARFLADSDVEEVYASGAVLVDPEIGEQGDIDTAMINLKFANGALGVIDNSRKAVYGYDQRVEVFGSKGCIQAQNKTQTKTVFSGADGVISEKPLFFFLERYNQAYLNELQAFYDAVTGKGEIPCDVADGLEAVLIGKAALKSLKENRPVKLTEISE